MPPRHSPLEQPDLQEARRASNDFYGAVVVAVVAVGMMQMLVHQVVDVITVRHRGVPAARTVDVVRVVTLAIVGDAAVRVVARYLYDVFVIVTFVGAVKMAVMQIADVVSVLYGDVTAIGAVLMVVVFMDSVGHFSLQVSGIRIQGYVRVCVLNDVSDERFYMSVCQAVKHVTPLPPSPDEILVKENSQAL